MNKLKLIQIIVKELEEIKILTEEVTESQSDASLIIDLALNKARLLCQEIELLRELSNQEKPIQVENVDNLLEEEDTNEFSDVIISEPELEILNFEDQEFPDGEEFNVELEDEDLEDEVQGDESELEMPEEEEDLDEEETEEDILIEEEETEEELIEEDDVSEDDQSRFEEEPDEEDIKEDDLLEIDEDNDIDNDAETEIEDEEPQQIRLLRLLS